MISLDMKRRPCTPAYCVYMVMQGGNSSQSFGLCICQMKNCSKDSDSDVRRAEN